MKFYGNANLQQNQLQQAVIPVDAKFPLSPKVGQFAFVSSILYICISLTSGNLPVWVPLTRELTMYTHTQTSANTSWVISHGLNTTSIQVQVFDTSNKMIIPAEITINSATQVTATFTSATTGQAVILSGHSDGNAKPSYAYIYYQNSAATSWVVTHNLGREPIVRVFVGNQEVQPASITFNTTNQLTIAFSASFAGVAKLI